jgi:DNA-binding CsgD family transcriptional regulator
VTAREREIIQLIAEGKSNKNAAVSAEDQREGRSRPTARTS